MSAVGKQNWLEWGAAAKPLAGQPVSGDLHLVEVRDRSALLAVIDGVGHGDEAKAVAQTAAGILKACNGESVITLARRCHEALVGTRGAVMTLATVDACDHTVTWLGVGNVEARLFRVEADVSHPCEHVLLRSGLLGLQLPALRANLMPLAPGDLLVFATDGIQTGFEGGITLTEPPWQIAEGILRRHFKGNDDALVLAARYTGLAP